MLMQCRIKRVSRTIAQNPTNSSVVRNIVDSYSVYPSRRISAEFKYKWRLDTIYIVAVMLHRKKLNIGMNDCNLEHMGAA